MLKIISEFFDIVNAYKDKKHIPEENVLLHIRAKGLDFQSRKKTLMSVIVSLPIQWIIDLLSLPLYLWTKMKRVILSLLISIFFHLALELDNENGVFFIFLFSLVIMNLSALSKWLQFFIFDLLDIISFSSLTKVWVFYYFANKSIHIDYLNNTSSPLILHIYISRQLVKGNPFQSEEDEFLELITSLTNDKNKLILEIDNYWERQDI